MTESGNSPTIVIPAKFQWIKINTPTPIKQWTEYLRKWIIFPHRVANRKEFRVRNDFEKFFQNLLLWEESFVVNLTREPNVEIVLNFQRNKRGYFNFLLTTIMCQESLLWTYDTSNVEQLWYCFGFSFVIAISRSPADILNFFTSTTKRNWKEIRLILYITKSSHVTLTMWLRVIFASCVVAHVDGQRWC